MSQISAQVSLYPLGEADLAPAIGIVLNILNEHDLTYQMGSMSTVVWGKDQIVFDALREAFAQVTRNRRAVMTITVSNACPLPAQPAAGDDS